MGSKAVFSVSSVADPIFTPKVGLATAGGSEPEFHIRLLAKVAGNSSMQTCGPTLVVLHT